MANKLKEIFSDDMLNMSGTLRFSDSEAYKNFLSALEIVYTEGRVVPVDGVASVSTAVGHLDTKFPLVEQTNITQVIVGPAEEPVPITLDVDGNKKTITLLRSRIKDKVILRSEPDFIVAFNIAFLLSENKHTLNYKVQFEKAKSIREVADSFNIAEALLAHLYNFEDNIPSEDGNISLLDIKGHFRRYKSFFKRLCAIENKLDISISPDLLNALSLEEQQDIDELYLLLCEKKVVRLSARLTSTSSTAVTMNNAEVSLSIGDKIALTFIGSIEFSFLKQSVTLYTANLLINALVKDIQKCDDGTVRVLYGDTDSKPMYISFSAFQTSEEAKQESEAILQHEDIYVNALTSSTYITQYYEKP